MTTWKIVGIIATAVIVLSLPLYALRNLHDGGSVENNKTLADAEFVGSDKCKDCHRPEYDKWLTSHHRMAMAVATDETVLGDFNDAEFEHFGVRSRFFRKDGKFFVHTQGPGGKMEDLEITHTFGWYPLQQYLVPFPGGRLQCLPITWDVKNKKWYHLYPDQPLEPDDWLYWTNNGQNWNGMCAECHSTDLKKKYNPETDTYQTTWSEISVGCEACHGPGSAHVQWAQLPDMARPALDNDALIVQTSGLDARQQIELCAPCHSRRMSLEDNIHAHADFLDYGTPQLLNEGMYFADGQILEEVYVYGSFMQSKMYARGVRCSDCHDVHSAQRVKEGNALCLQCHKAGIYDTKDHHFHKAEDEKGEPIRSETGEILFDVGSGALCEQCHMPGRNYMGIDYRPDHSFRIPRPDLSVSIGTPNACNRCHIDKSNQWSAETMVKWYGQRRRTHYGTVLNAGRLGQPEALPDLIRLADDRLYPAIVRATALMLLSSYGGVDSRETLERALADEEALIRQTAVRQLAASDPQADLALFGPLLYDPVKAVRIEAAQKLTAIPMEEMTSDIKIKFQSALREYVAAMERTGDFAASRHNLGNMYANLGDSETAIANYRKAIEIDRMFYPAKVNLAMLYSRIKANDQAEQLFREVVGEFPELYEIKYSLGLLLAEKKQYEEAAEYLAQAAEGLPQRARIHYNLGLLHQYLQRDQAAEIALQRAVDIDPNNLDFLYALADFYLKRNRWDDAGRIAESMVTRHPDQKIGHDILEFIKGKRRS
jgi:predicted CXXCH cytochrome family protein